MLLTLLHLFNECLGLLLVGEGQTGGAVFKFESVEECTVLVIVEVVENFLVPNHALSMGRNVDNFEPEGPSYKVVADHSCSLHTCIFPLLGIWVGNVESRDSYGQDLVGWFGDMPLNGFLIRIGEN